jgi:hypothetical protein
MVFERVSFPGGGCDTCHFSFYTRGRGSACCLLWAKSVLSCGHPTNNYHLAPTSQLPPLHPPTTTTTYLSPTFTTPTQLPSPHPQHQPRRLRLSQHPTLHSQSSTHHLDNRGWGASFHFATRFAGESFKQSILRHEHQLAAKVSTV